MKTFSIRRRLLVALLSGLALVWIVMLALGYQKVREEIHELSDARLQQAARTLLVLDLKRLGRLARSEAAVNELPDSEHADEALPLAFQAWNERGQLLIGSTGAPATSFDPREGFDTRILEGQPWRSYSVRDRKHGYLLTVLEPLVMRDHPVHELAARMGQVLLLALPILAALIWLTVSRGLLPLARLSAAIATRDAQALAPIVPAQLPEEAAQLIEALNALLARLRQSLEMERAFTADAAHELRTPLAAIKVQAEVALASTRETERRQALEQLIIGVDRGTHLVKQLLQLARIEHGTSHLHQTVALDELAAQAIAARAGQAVQRGMELSLDASTHGRIAGDQAMLRILIDNLIDNAIKYGCSDGAIEVRIWQDESGPVLTVSDDGEGVSATNFARLHDRFFRVEGTGVSGSGLGLSIVEKIAAAHHANIQFHSGISGRGLGVSVRFGGE